MTDGQSLLLLFVVLYLLEGLRWLPPSSQLLTGSGRRWQARAPFQPVMLAGRCPVLLSVLPPLQAHLPTLPWQLIPAAEGLEVHLDARRPLLLPWTSLQPAAEGRTLFLTAGIKIPYFHEEHAQYAQQQVIKWISQPQEIREADFLQHAAQSLLTAPLTARAEALTAQTRSLRHLGSFILVWTFLVIVSLYRWLGEGVAVLGAAGGLLLLQITQAVLLYRRAQGVPFRFWKALATALLPQHAMRAADHLCDVSLSAPAHPLATRELVGEEAWKQMAFRVWKKACYQPSATADLQCRVLEAYLKKAGLPVSEIDAAPPQQTGSATYCPSCQSQFQPGPSVCQDCGGIQLRPFKVEAAS